MQAVRGLSADCVSAEVASGSLFSYQFGIDVCFSYLP